VEPVRLCPQGARNVRAGRTGAPGSADGTDRRRAGLAVPALRRVRDRRAARQRTGRGGAAAPPGARSCAASCSCACSRWTGSSAS
jgi:hypothetical protein